MKKLLLPLLMLLTLNISAQIEKIEGIWSSEQSSYLTVIFYSNGKFLFKNLGIDESKLKETVINQGKNFVTTTLVNSKNNHKVTIKYTLLKNNELLGEFLGDWKGTVIHKKN